MRLLVYIAIDVSRELHIKTYTDYREILVGFAHFRC